MCQSNDVRFIQKPVEWKGSQYLHNCMQLSWNKVFENKLSGHLDIMFSIILNILSMHPNRFDRNLPFSLVNCTKLQVLDLRKNTLSGDLLKYPSSFQGL